MLPHTPNHRRQAKRRLYCEHGARHGGGRIACFAPSGLGNRMASDPGRRSAAVAAPLCPGLVCGCPFGAEHAVRVAKVMVHGRQHFARSIFFGGTIAVPAEDHSLFRFAHLGRSGRTDSAVGRGSAKPWPHLSHRRPAQRTRGATPGDGRLSHTVAGRNRPQSRVPLAHSATVAEGSSASRAFRRPARPYRGWSGQLGVESPGTDLRSA